VLRRIGETHARRFFFTGERFDAAHARHIGLLQEVVPVEDLDATVAALVDKLLLGGPAAQQHCKALVFHGVGLSAERQLELDQHTARVIAKLRTSAEGREGMQAFLDKRKPDWVK